MPRQASQSSLETPVQYVKGIGPKRSTALKRLGIHTVRDLLYYLPRDYLDLSRTETIANLRRVADSDQYVTAIGTVKTFDLVGRPPRQRFVVMLGDQTGTVPLIFFQSIRYFTKAFHVGETIAVSGKVTTFQHRSQFVHPSIDRLSSSQDQGEDGGELEGFLHTKGIVPKYPLTEELHQVNLETKALRRIVKAAIDQFLDALEEFLPEDIHGRLDLLGLRDAIRQVHFPDSHTHLEAARRRLKFDELFSLELLLALRRKVVKVESPGIAFVVESKLARSLVDALPFALTKAQVRVVREIVEDMRSRHPMNRLLQGDVGSGKTVVAVIAMLIAVENGFQSAFMAPTEILAEQHLRTLGQFLNDLGVTVRLLIGGQAKTLREDVLEDVHRGTAQIVIGTHALIQEEVDFANLGLVVIDEQHRFGVAQRLALREKGLLSRGRLVHPDILVMTATPIPRTLSLTLYGDLDVSVINELPMDRKPVKTMLKFDYQHAGVFAFVRQEITKGRQAYIVFPLVEESEKLDLKAATESFHRLQKEIFPEFRLGLIHGRLPASEKDAIMDSFKRREIQMLVSTTVIEVGIDVPNATVMVIEHAERFGLSQLHQLRGRVGRGSDQSFCLLIAPDWMARTGVRNRDDGADVEERRKAETRLRTMLKTTDGFKIAEVDLQLRGPGDFFGMRQSGFPELRIADIVTDGAIVDLAREEAFRIVDTDPHLRLPVHQSLKKYFGRMFRDHLALLEAG